MIESRLLRRRGGNMAFFDHFFRISLIKILFQFVPVTDLYILTLFGPLYQTRGVGACESLCAETQNRPKIAHARQRAMFSLKRYFLDTF